jgi:hypothetical protein
MNLGWAATSVGYSLFQIVQGLLMHPYQTMRQLVRERVFVWMVGSPIFLWLGSVIVWKILNVLLFSLFPYPGFWTFLALWFTIGIGFYQILLTYLLIRFSFILKSA